MAHRLRLDTSAAAAGFRVLEDEFGRLEQVGAPIRHLPPFDFRYVQEGRDLVPLARGVLTWLFDASGEVSRAAWQIVSETCAYFRFDAWGVVAADQQPLDPGAEAAAALARLRDHERARLPVRPLSRLDEDYPGVDHTELGFSDGLAAADLTVMGMRVGGIHYRSDCPTRQGLYPYCTTLPLPSYSTAKSLFAGIGLMRLQQMYPGSSRRTLASLIEACSGQKWRDVTIEDALDMATGNYDSTVMYEDEDAPGHLDFIFADGHAEKLRLACGLFERRSEPGRRAPPWAASTKSGCRSCPASAALPLRCFRTASSTITTPTATCIDGRAGAKRRTR
ncbi:MAG: hypothetical protein RQ826_06595 [Xanthomonadales bacterium]|nr:hypothetical protein [Xanthomonadales bacterium]